MYIISDFISDHRIFCTFISIVGVIILFRVHYKHHEAMKEFYEQKKDSDGTSYYLIKKRSSSLPIKVKEYDFLLYEYKQDTPHYRTMIVGHAATTQYVDNSGLKPVKTYKSGKGHLYINNDPVYPYLTFSKELMDEFKEKYPNSHKYQTRTDYSKNAEELCLYKHLSPLRVNGWWIPDGYSRYYNYYAKNVDIIIDYEEFETEELINLVSWLKNDAS